MRNFFSILNGIHIAIFLTRHRYRIFLLHGPLFYCFFFFFSSSSLHLFADVSSFYGCLSHFYFYFVHNNILVPILVLCRVRLCTCTSLAKKWKFLFFNSTQTMYKSLSTPIESCLLYRSTSPIILLIFFSRFCFFLCSVHFSITSRSVALWQNRYK